MPDTGNTVTLDLGEKRVKDLLDAIVHIETAMSLVDKHGGPFASLASAKQTLSEHVGSMLLNRSRNVLQQRQSDVTSPQNA